MSHGEDILMGPTDNQTMTSVYKILYEKEQ